MPPVDDADLNAGGGDTGDGSKDLNKDKQGDDEVVPKRQFLAAIKSASDKNAALQAQIDELKAGQQKKADPPKRYSRADLNAAVENKQVSQEAADQIWDDQIQAEANARAEQVATATVTRAQRKERVDSDIDQYTALEPEILVEGSVIREKVAKEYQFLVSLGDPKTHETELKAIRAALGPLDQLKLARSGKDVHDTHRETGGSGGDGGKPKGGNKDTPNVNKLDSRKREYYEGQIKGGQYKDWKDVEATLTYANPETRPRLGA